MWAFCGKSQSIMSFINRIINRFSKNTPISEMIVDDSEPIKVELKKGSGKIVRILFYETGTEMNVSEDVDLVLINRNAAELCQ